MSNFIDDLKEAAGNDYKQWAIQARKEYLNVYLNQDKEIRKIYQSAIYNLTKRMKGTKNSFSLLFMKQLQKELREYAKELESKLTDYLQQQIEKGVETGSQQMLRISQELFKGTRIAENLPLIFTNVNQKAIQACYARTKNGLYLSDRIWMTSQQSAKQVKKIIQGGIATGMDAVKTAKALERYVKEGAETFSIAYPNMKKRIGRVPKTLSYEALRLARTEYTAAFGEAVILGSKVSPGVHKVQWVLSGSHPQSDICDGLAKVYDLEEAPAFPAHPNCLCQLVPIVEDIAAFKRKVKAWIKQPESQPQINDWYENIYLQSKKITSNNCIIKEKEYKKIKGDTLEKTDHNIMTILTPMTDKWVKKLGGKEIKAVQVYSGSSYTAMNDHLRFGKAISAEKKEIISDLSSALKKFQLTENIITYRTRKLSNQFTIDQVRALKGQLLHDKGFMSTSVAEVFGRGAEVLFEIKVPAGTTCAYIEPLSQYKNERELLLDKGTMLKIIDVEEFTHSKRKFIIKAEVKR